MEFIAIGDAISSVKRFLLTGEIIITWKETVINNLFKLIGSRSVEKVVYLHLRNSDKMRISLQCDLCLTGIGAQMSLQPWISGSLVSSYGDSCCEPWCAQDCCYC
jgi:hypothetical protein